MVCLSWSHGPGCYNHVDLCPEPPHVKSHKTEADRIQDQPMAPQLDTCLGSEGSLRVPSSVTLEPSFHHSEGRAKASSLTGQPGVGLLL